MSLTEDATITSKGQVTIPKEIRNALGLDAGTEVEFTLDEEGQLTVKPKQPAMDRLREVKQQLSEHSVDLDAMREESKRQWSSLDGSSRSA